MHVVPSLPNLPAVKKPCTCVDLDGYTDGLVLLHACAVDLLIFRELGPLPGLIFLKRCVWGLFLGTRVCQDQEAKGLGLYWPGTIFTSTLFGLGWC